ncbi:hypothetical protein BTW32_26255 [Bacillus thuringiensis]|nr:hypothetical protein BTW32_26255 [Bacillus thuringiensis]
MIEGAGATQLSFRIMEVEPLGTDPTAWSDVKHGSVLTMMGHLGDRDRICIANPKGYNSRGSFKVKFYLL